MDIIQDIDISNLDANQVTSVVASVMALGALYCFLGHKTLKFIIGLTGFIIAGCVAGLLVHWVTDGHTISMLIAAVIGGTSGAFALFFLYKSGIFSLGLLGATLVAHNVLADRPESWAPLAVLGLGVVGGLFALLIERPVMIMATAVLGAWLLVSGGAYFYSGSPEITDLTQAFTIKDERPLILGCWLVLSIAGFMAQWATGKKNSGKPEGDGKS
jgi:hypothetical protein